MHKKKIAIVLMNLGGPDSPKAVRPFLYHLFSDPYILRLPTPFRLVLAWILSWIRAQKAQKIYDHLGGKSPLLDNTKHQATALQEVLNKKMPSYTFQSFIAMRYWHPFTHETIHEVTAFSPDHIILLPLYPQFSTTTSGSSFFVWDALFNQAIPVEKICCYPTDPGFITAHQDLIRKTIATFPHPPSSLRLLFSAHGLPQKIINQGDPYQEHVEKTVSCIMESDLKTYDYQICYQSRVGPLEWIGPHLEDAMQQAALDQKAVLVIPISFVSEHSETLVELDIDFKNRAKTLHLLGYGRVPALSCHPNFIQGLAERILKTLEKQGDLAPSPCSKKALQCFCQKK